MVVAGNGLVDGEVPGATNDFGVSLVGNNAAFGIGNSDVTISSGLAVNDGQWHHILATGTATSGLMQLYVDGVLRASGTGATGTHATPTTLHIGNLKSGVNYFAGSIDEVRIYNFALNSVQAKQLATPASTPRGQLRPGRQTPMTAAALVIWGTPTVTSPSSPARWVRRRRSSTASAVM